MELRFLGTKSAINLRLTIWSHLWNIIWKYLWIKGWDGELRSSQNSCRRTSVTVMIRESVEKNWSVELKCNIALTHAICWGWGTFQLFYFSSVDQILIKNIFFPSWNFAKWKFSINFEAYEMFLISVECNFYA